MITDKKNLIPEIQKQEFVELELGCGNKKKKPSAIGIDALDYPNVDIVGDIYEVLARFPAGSVDAVSSSHFVEHVPDVQKLLSELARITKSNGKVEFVAPHFSNPYFYSDPTHRQFFGLYTFCYFADHSPFTRSVPTYGHKIEFSISKIDLIFKSPRHFFVRHFVKRLFGRLFNSCVYMKELWEENLCYLFPCYEIKYLIIRHERSN